MLLPGFIKWQGCRHLPAIRWYIECVYVRVYVACSTKVTCPVTMLKRYMDMGGLSSSSGILFRPLAKGGWNPLGSLSQILEFTALDQEVLLLQLKLEYQTDYSRGMVVVPQIAPRMAMLRTHLLLSWELHKD